MKTTITEAEFDELLASVEHTAFRLETHEVYALSYEREDFNRFLAGKPIPPPEVDWWRPWLEQISRQTREGKRISRVRFLSDPLSDYQRWELWATPWHTAAGEQIGYLSRRRAAELALPLAGDWWLLDDTRLILMSFTPAGELAGKTLTDDPSVVATYCAWRSTAERNALPATPHASP